MFACNEIDAPFSESSTTGNKVCLDIDAFDGAADLRTLPARGQRLLAAVR